MNKRFTQFLLALFLITNLHAQDKYWTASNTTTSKVNSNSIFGDYNHKEYKTFTLKEEDFKQHLRNAPVRGIAARNNTTTISFPNDAGKMETFQVWEASNFAPELAAKFPEIKSYIGYSIDNPFNRVRFSTSPSHGISAMISYADKPTVFIQPVMRGSQNYIAYNRGARGNKAVAFECKTIGADDVIERNAFVERAADDQKLRDFRIAISVNGEYTAYHGGTVAAAMAAINTSLTRVNEVFETDFAITLTLIANNNLVVFTDAATDPYTVLNNWNGELQTTLTNIIGEANYDVGHMFGASGGGGNAGCIGCVCVDGQKGSGITSPADAIPETDTFDIDFVAHELGHQFGGNHTWSFRSEGTGVNVEPGSGSTIMGYAGITNDDVQPHSDPYFHYASIDQIMTNVATKTCQTETDITNSPPVVNAGPDYTIPQGTAYVLRGSATDANGADVLTYCWEQNDDGIVTSGSFGPTAVSGAMVRSYNPTTSPNRYIPRFNRIMAGQLTESNPPDNTDMNNLDIWETVATVGRSLNFVLTVRDRMPNATGQTPQNGFDEMRVTVDAASGPFIITSQSTSETWNAGEMQTVTWDVAGTDTGAINESQVNILLTTDQGQTFTTIASNVPNNGSANIIVPNVVTTTGRIVVEASNNIFLAVNSANIAIQEVEFILTPEQASYTSCTPDNITINYTYNTFLGFTGSTNLTVSGNPAGSTATLTSNPVSTDGEMTTLTLSGITPAMAGNHTILLTGTSGSVTSSASVDLTIYTDTFNTVTLNTPTDGAVSVMSPYTLSWTGDTNATQYMVEIASDNAFGTIVEAATVPTTSFTPTVTLNIDTEYFWRVKPLNDCGEGTFSTPFSFTTANIACNTYNATDTPLNIPDNDANGVRSTLTLTDDFTLTDVNVTINITHPWDGDLDIFLISPAGTQVELTSDNGSSGDNYTNTTFDDDATDPITSGSAPFTGTFSPEGSLASFNGEQSVGDWVLLVSDDGGEDIGTLDSWSINICGIPPSDMDNDGVFDTNDNCPNTANADQLDTDGDGIGDVCDDDDDNDTILDINDNCPLIANTDQLDTNGDGEGDVCDDDDDGDGILDVNDNCPLIANADQADADGDGEGDVCDNDTDNDGIIDANDNCPNTANADQLDTDGDGIGDVCDDDDDNDTILDVNDNCPLVANTDQADADGDGIGDVCDDNDGDGILDINDNCPDTANADQADADGDGIGDVCDDDNDNDGITNANDNCPDTVNADQADADGDGIGDVCDDDDDNDGVADANDTCPGTPAGTPVDVNGCEIFTLPANNFQLQTADETCRNANNGSISITATDLNYTYTVTVTGNGANMNQDFNSDITLSSLAAGTYNVCITIATQPTYQQCYNIVITEPEDLSVVSRVLSNRIALTLEGGSTYTITVNDAVYTTSDNEIEVPLAQGENIITVKADAECQGVYREVIMNGEEMSVYPNPVVNDLFLYTGNSDLTNATITVYSLSGQAVYTSKAHRLDNGNARINLSEIAAGIYMMKVDTEVETKTFKIIKN